MAETIEERVAGLEELVGYLVVSNKTLQEKLSVAEAKVRDLQQLEGATLSAYEATHPPAAADMEEVSRILGLSPGGDDQDNKKPES